VHQPDNSAIPIPNHDMAAKTANEPIIEPETTLRYLGIPIKSKVNSFVTACQLWTAISILPLNLTNSTCFSPIIG